MTNDVGKIIQIYREKAGWTQDELGQKVGVSQQTIAKWESGKSSPRPKVLERVVAALKFDPKHIKEILPSSRIEAWADTLELRAAHTVDEIEPISDDALQALNNTQLDLFPSRSSFSLTGIEGTLKKLIAPVVNELDPSSQWDPLVASPFGNVRVDYANKELYAIFMHAGDPASLMLILRSAVYRPLWRYMTLSGAGQINSHYQLLIITLPEDQPIDFDPQSARGMRWPSANQKTLQRITSEALSIGIYVILARTPRDVVKILTKPSSIHDPGWEWPGRQWEENPET